MGKTNISRQRKQLSPEGKKKRLDKRYTEDPNEYTIGFCWNAFIVNRMTRGNTEASLEAYRRFYKKLCSMTSDTEAKVEEMPISMIDADSFKATFILNLKNKDGTQVSQQTINHYLRSYRAFGHFCEEEGYIPSGFSLTIKEVEPPIKDVYTEAELKKLLKEPNIEDFVEYRNFAIITLILTTGARANTILNLRIRDFDAETGYIIFNTTKAHNTTRIGLDPHCVDVLRRYVKNYRSFPDTEETDYLFCSVYETQLTRSALCKTISEYNHKRGVSKTSIHLFRHTFAKMWITSGGDIISLAKVLTHSELEMVKRYSNLYSSDVKEEIIEHSALSQVKQVRKKSINSRK